MDREIISRIEAWESRPATGGYAGLTELADAGFSGAVVSGGTRLFMLNGRVVGVFDGAISAFEDGDATAHEAPDPSLPLLFAMRERGGEVRGKYYTDDTPVQEVDDTLSSGGFTGYLELSENVLSGDYYVVYYGGRSLSVAFVGNESRVVTGKEAFDLTADEVGIYEVRSVDLEVVDVPEPDPRPEPTAAAVDEPDDDDAAEGTEADEAPDEEEEDAAAEPVETDDEAPSFDDGAGREPSTVDDEVGEEEPPDGTVAEEPEPVEDDEPDATVVGAAGAAVEEAEDATEKPDEPVESEEPASPSTGTADAAPGPSAASDDDRPAGRTASAEAQRPPGQRGTSPRTAPDERFEEEARWREARTVPALDPEESALPLEREAPLPRRTEPERPPATSDRGAESGELTALQERIGRLESELESSEHERQRLTERLEQAVAERDELEAERDSLTEQIADLEARIGTAEAAAAAASSDSGGSSGSEAPAGRPLDPETALDQTDLFVRYSSKGKPTLQTAHDGRASREEVGENLRIESHSRFDAGTATVGGRPFRSFLEDTIQYRFVVWLVEELLYEIQETGTESGLRALYDVLPNVDRAEFNGTVVTRDVEAGETREESFDVICRNRMGKPLLVANINDSLDPATGDMMAKLVEDATTSAEGQESMGAAFLVTASFFEPDALETASDATRGGGFLSRDSKKSFVKLSRNGGYHLCLVEARGDDFHVAVPEF